MATTTWGRHKTSSSPRQKPPGATFANPARSLWEKTMLREGLSRAGDGLKHATNSSGQVRCSAAHPSASRIMAPKPSPAHRDKILGPDYLPDALNVSARATNVPKKLPTLPSLSSKSAPLGRGLISA